MLRLLLDTSKLNVGRHEGVLTISTPCEDIAAIKIPYRARVTSPARAIPGRVFFGRCALGETKVEKTTIVVMPGIVDDDAEFQYTVSDPAILTIALGKKSTFGQELLVHLTPNAEGDIHETIMVDIKDDSKRFRSVIIPVVGRCYAKDNNADGNIVEKRALSLCGPHCIQYVLKHYGRNLTFEEVVEDIPSYHPNRGTTLYDLKKAIESHGFTTLAIRCERFPDQRPDCLVIVHLKGEKYGGHFAVLLPKDDSRSLQEQECLWMGPDEYLVLPPRALERLLSGAMLFVIPSARETELQSMSISTHENCAAQSMCPVLCFEYSLLDVSTLQHVR